MRYTPNPSTYNSVRWPIFPFDAFTFCVYEHTVIYKSVVCALGVSILRIHHSRWLQERQTRQGFTQHLITQSNNEKGSLSSFYAQAKFVSYLCIV